MTSRECRPGRTGRRLVVGRGGRARLVAAGRQETASDRGTAVPSASVSSSLFHLGGVVEAAWRCRAPFLLSSLSLLGLLGLLSHINDKMATVEPILTSVK